MGNWIQGFSTNIGLTSIFLTKFWALRNELLLCKNLQSSAVETELDAKPVVDFVYRVKDTNGPISFLLDDCRLLVSQIFRWRPS